ncbi:MAG: sel1 repeat family protein [candidate division NC10 bacterium]|nr:sel1 repeat family protein [candidate division NC10 bacterium]
MSRILMSMCLALSIIAVAAAPAPPASSPSTPPVVRAGPLATARPAPWNFAELEKEAKTLSSADIPDLRARASGGDARSQFLLGLAYEFGYGGATKDLQEALRWFKQAAEQGIGLPQRWVGDFYYLGIGIPVDFAEAWRWYRRSSDNGQHFASTLIGYLYLAGQGVARDYSEARRWFQVAANAGDVTARKIMAELEWNCSTQFCMDLQTLLVLRGQNFYLIRGEKVDEIAGKNYVAEAFGLVSTIVTKRWRGKLLIGGAESCEVRSEESPIDGPPSTYYFCTPGRGLSRAEASARFDEVTVEIRAAAASTFEPPLCAVVAHRRQRSE